jgi:inhibitor of KinA sporulation pathway (predicted exonuclease)
MNYIVFDLEFNQAFNFGKDSKEINPKCPFEIIDIGAVKLDENLREVGTLARLVKPKIYHRLHPYVKKITGIHREDLKAAKPFKEVYKEFVNLLDSKSVLCVWGTSDIKELIRNIEYHKLDSSVVPQEYIDLQQYASKFLNNQSGNTIGLKNAVELLNIPLETKFHSAFNDAWYTAEVFKKINTDQIKPKIYIHTKDAKPEKHQKKVAVDTEKLMKQFEKIFGREMTDEEQRIIKLAYRMGSRNEFSK